MTEDEARERVIAAMCPERVCNTCGEPSRRITRVDGYTQQGRFITPNPIVGVRGATGGISLAGKGITKGTSGGTTVAKTTTGWTDCGHDDWRPGLVLDPFA